MTLKDLISQDITERCFWNIDSLLDNRGFFRRGKTKNRLSLLEDGDELANPEGIMGSLAPENVQLAQLPASAGSQPTNNFMNFPFFQGTQHPSRA